MTPGRSFLEDLKLWLSYFLLSQLILSLKVLPLESWWNLNSKVPVAQDFTCRVTFSLRPYDAIVIPLPTCRVFHFLKIRIMPHECSWGLHVTHPPTLPLPSYTIVLRVRYQYPRVSVVLKACWFRTNSNLGHEFCSTWRPTFLILFSFIFFFFFFLKQRRNYSLIKGWGRENLCSEDSFLFIHLDTKFKKHFPSILCVQGCLELVGIALVFSQHAWFTLSLLWAALSHCPHCPGRTRDSLFLGHNAEPNNEPCTILYNDI